MMAVDRDLKIIHANGSTRKLLREDAAAFRTMWPSFNPDAIIGTCIDVFHKAPSHQRQILADPNRLPYRTDITVGDLKFARNVSAVFDNQRNYVGNVLQWDDVATARLNSGMLAVLNRAQAIIAFTVEGTILNANNTFVNAIGYRLDDIRGRHYRMFMDTADAAKPEYAAFWEALRRGEYRTGEYRRVGSGNRTIWIQARYNPILDGNGRPMKVVEFPIDITATVGRRLRHERLSNEIGQDLAGITDNISAVSRQASEVAGAASQTSETIQSVAAEVVGALKAIQGSVNAISGSIAEVASAVQQQSAATSEISATMQSASLSVTSIDKGIGAMANAMGSAAHPTEQVRGNMDVLVK